ncbi:terminase small subunit [Haliea sp. E1-2-M8]|uniref:terminase small subunit n=1 Tax=Haliea sp. E1-2-M8 TaxID=3064706 RepID=UPI002715B7C8|nr:terminase small subunit [Haliea sp. E1-2-M8]MDO8864132.1 terminase small subunit [Haliea sp. E1-2-M8]
MPDDTKKLTPKQEVFVQEYLVDLNATQAAIRAGYAPKRADAIGFENLRKPEIADAIDAAKTERSERTQIDSEYVLRRLAEIDQMDAADLFDDQGRLLPIRQWPKVWRQYISGMDVTEMWGGRGDREVAGVLKKVKWPDKGRNLELLGRHVTVQAWKENAKVEVADNRLVETLNAALARAGVKPE